MTVELTRSNNALAAIHCFCEMTTESSNPSDSCASLLLKALHRIYTAKKCTRAKCCCPSLMSKCVLPAQGCPKQSSSDSCRVRRQPSAIRSGARELQIWKLKQLWLQHKEAQTIIRGNQAVMRLQSGKQRWAYLPWNTPSYPLTICHRDQSCA